MHRAGACLKETLEVNREAGGRIGLRLLAGDAARASELRAVLSRVASSPYLDVDIQIGRPRAHARAVASVQAPAMTMVERWNGVWDEGLALVELANHLGANTRISLTPESRLLLRTMLRDHAEAMSARIASVRAILAHGSSLGEAPAPALSEDSGGAGGDWRNACLRMFQAIDRVDPLIETDSVRPEGIPAQELPLLHESLSKVDYWAGVLIRNGNSLRMSVSSAPGSGDATARNPRLEKGAPR